LFDETSVKTTFTIGKLAPAAYEIGRLTEEQKKGRTERATEQSGLASTTNKKHSTVIS
jgi:hypothetical protein